MKEVSNCTKDFFPILRKFLLVMILVGNGCRNDKKSRKFNGGTRKEKTRKKKENKSPKSRDEMGILRGEDQNNKYPNEEYDSIRLSQLALCKK